MATGKVKWFNNAKGYGFILPEGGGDDLFAHYSSIQMEGYKTLKAGQDVEFDMLEGPKGHHAVNIRPAETLDDEMDGEMDGEMVDGAAAEAPERAPVAVVHNGSKGSTS
ncbi:MAG: cold shock domain-containing protein CspD [Pseudomonadales bacterium]